MSDGVESEREMLQSTCVKCEQDCCMIFDNGHCVVCAVEALAKILGDLENP